MKVRNIELVPEGSQANHRRWLRKSVRLYQRQQPSCMFFSAEFTKDAFNIGFALDTHFST
jgi:alpha-L-fucosidase